MKLFIAILLLGLRCHAAPAFVACTGTNEQAAGATTVTVSVTPTGGSGHLLVAYGRNGGAATNTITDNSGSNTWIAVSPEIAFDFGNSARMWYAMNAVAGTYTVTDTLGTSQGSRAITVCEYSGIATASALDTSTTVACAFQGVTCTTGVFTTTNANDLIVLFTSAGCTTCIYAGGPIGGVTATVRATNANDIGMEDLNVSSIQTGITANITMSTGSNAFGMSLGAFKAAAGGSKCVSCDISQLQTP